MFPNLCRSINLSSCYGNRTKSEATVSHTGEKLHEIVWQGVHEIELQTSENRPPRNASRRYNFYFASGMISSVAVAFASSRPYISLVSLSSLGPGHSKLCHVRPPIFREEDIAFDVSAMPPVGTKAREPTSGTCVCISWQCRQGKDDVWPTNPKILLTAG